MSSLFTKDEIAELYAPFALEEHDIREGHKSKAGDKIQWFVYADRYAVQHRLERLFPGEWGVDYSDAFRGADHTSIVCRITIRGLTRAFNGGQGLRYANDEIDHESEKGAGTDAFRRAASMWGIGLYLYEGFVIWTASYPDKDYKARDERAAEARQKFQVAYQKRFTKQPGKTDDAWTLEAKEEWWGAAFQIEGMTKKIALSILGCIETLAEFKGTKSEAFAKLEEYKRERELAF